MKPDVARVEVRGPDSKHLYGYLDPVLLLLEVKRKGGMIERIDLKPLISTSTLVASTIAEL